MAEEGNLGVARALETDVDNTKADLQSRMEVARESIKESVSEIKDTVVNQYNSVRESVADGIDWREQVRKRPVACGLGALGVGILVGYGLAGLIERDDEPIDNGVSEDMLGEPVEYEAGGPSAFSESHSYAAHARAIARVDDEHSKPGLIERFKETHAYDRLQGEVSELGTRFMDGLVDAARAIVFPVLFTKVKEAIGIDLAKTRETGKAPVRQPNIVPDTDEPTHRPTENAIPVIPSTESGKAAYPRSSGSLSKLDRLAGDQSSSIVQSDSTPHINLNYDDRYERESQLFSRGEDRRFGARALGETKAATEEKRSTDSDDVPHGKDFIYDAGHS